MPFRLNYAQYQSVFVVPTSVVDNHLRLCGAVQLKALLYILRNGERSHTPEELSAALRVSTGDVRDALLYWVEAGVLVSTEEEAPEKAPVAEGSALPTAGEGSAHADPAEQLATPEAAPARGSTPPDRLPERTIVATQKPRLTRGEVIRLVQNSRELGQLLHEVQAALEKPLTSVEMDTVVALYSYYGLGADFILMVIHYCKSIGKNNMRYVEKTAASWVDEGIDTHEKAEQHIARLTERHSREGQVRSAFGIGDRKLIASEQKYVQTWFSEYGFDIALIRLAYERTIENIGKLNFPYIHKILTSWHQNGITTTKQAAEDMSQRRESQPQQQTASYDIGQLERQILSDFINYK